MTIHPTKQFNSLPLSLGPGQCELSLSICMDVRIAAIMMILGFSTDLSASRQYALSGQCSERKYDKQEQLM